MDNSQPYLPQGATDPELAPTPEQPKDRFPVGLILIIILTGMGMVGSLFQVVNPKIMIGMTLVTGVPAFLYSVVQLAAYVALFVWLIRRKERGRILGIVMKTFAIVVGSVNFGIAFMNPEGFAESFEQLVPGLSSAVNPRFVLLISGIAYFVASLVGLAVILYLVFNKQHFRP